MSGTKKDSDDLDLHPDAWERFERAAEVVGKSPPQHKVKTEIEAPKKGLRKDVKDPRS